MLHTLANTAMLDAGFMPLNAPKTATASTTQHTDQAIFLVYIDRAYGLVGGAKLTPVAASAKSSLYRRSMGIALGDKVWECSHVFFDIEGLEDLERHESKAYALTQRFYHDLFEGIRAFAQQKGIKHIVTRHSEAVHEELRYAGSWPFVVEMMDAGAIESQPEVFGVLSLSASSYDVFRKNAASSSSLTAESFLI